MLQATQLTWRPGQHNGAQPVVSNASITVQKGECVGLVGPNGCGKSSLLRMLYRMYTPEAGGQVLLHGQDIWQMTAREFALHAAVLAQESSHGFDSTVYETVMMGRLPHQSKWARDSAEDKRVVQSCLGQVGALALARQRFSSLSGGEKQRVLLARALAQQPQLLFLDEPTNHLDIRYQLELMGLLRQLGCTVVVVVHDLNIAAQFCHRIYLMQAGALVASGTPQQALTPAAIAQVFGVQAAVDTHPATAQPRISYWMEDAHG